MNDAVGQPLIQFNGAAGSHRSGDLGGPGSHHHEVASHLRRPHDVDEVLYRPGVPTASIRPHVVIVGAGLAGLSCALHLHQAGLRCQVLEASDDVGGRMRTDRVGGFRLDRGFQVLLTAYPEARSVLDPEGLALRSFQPGAVVRFHGGFHTIGDPFRQPSQAWSTLTSPVGSLRDKLGVLRLRHRCARGALEKQLAAPELAAHAFLRSCGIESRMIDAFFRPFLGGVFLDSKLETSSRMLRFVWRMFSRGGAALPARGMAEIPRQLAARLPSGWIRRHAVVDSVGPRQVILAHGEVIPSERVVVATDGATAAHLIDGVRPPTWCGVSCLYFAADRPPIREPILILNGEGVGPINNLCFPTQVAPEYGPEGQTLVSVSVIGAEADRPDLVDAVVAQLIDWFGDDARSWDHLRTYRIRRALPRQLPGWLEPAAREVRVNSRLYVAGDHVDTASSNGALGAGRRAAEAVLRDLSRQRREEGG